jgi:DnaJ-class molecular chaperone
VVIANLLILMSDKETQHRAFGPTRCHYCDGRGFLIIQQTTLEGKILPNHVEDCEWCNGEGFFERDS